MRVKTDQYVTNSREIKKAADADYCYLIIIFPLPLTFATGLLGKRSVL